MKQEDSFETGFAAGAASVPACSQKVGQGSHSKSNATGKKALMHVGTQGFGSSEEDLLFLKRCGVDNKVGSVRFNPGRGWDIDDICREKDQHEKFGISMDMIPLPITGLKHIIYYGKSPERDREIDLACDMIRTAAKAEIPALKYNTCILPIDRTDPEPGRGGYYHTALRLDKIPKEFSQKLTDAGRVTREMFWERITYLLDRIVPVATEYKVRLANSQQDPPVPDGYRGVDKTLNTVDGMKRFIEIHRGPYHGWNFCIGSIGEMLEDPASEICDVVRYFGERDTIFLVHYRNIIGKRYSFREALPDEGDMNMYLVMKALKQVGYSYMVVPDHVPYCPDSPAGRREGYAFCFAYIKAMIQAVNDEV